MVQCLSSVVERILSRNLCRPGLWEAFRVVSSVAFSGVWHLKGPEPSKCSWQSGFKILMLKFPNALFSTTVTRTTSVTRWRKCACQSRLGWLVSFCGCSWIRFSQSLWTEEGFYGVMGFGEEGQFQEARSGTLIIIWRRWAEFRNSLNLVWAERSLMHFWEWSQPDPSPAPKAIQSPAWPGRWLPLPHPPSLAIRFFW